MQISFAVEMRRYLPRDRPRSEDAGGRVTSRSLRRDAVLLQLYRPKLKLQRVYETFQGRSAFSVFFDGVV